VVDPTIVARLVKRARPARQLAELTEREREVLGLMAEGRSNKAICARLFLSPKTVEASDGSTNPSSNVSGTRLPGSSPRAPRPQEAQSTILAPAEQVSRIEVEVAERPRGGLYSREHALLLTGDRSAERATSDATPGIVRDGSAGA